MDKELYTTNEAAEFLGVHREQILKLIRMGRLAASNVGTGKKLVYRIQARDISKYLKENKCYGKGTPKNQESS